jgi:flagellar hook protein FlgE
MLRSLFSGISGLRSHQTMMDVTGNNIANVNTTGFKSSQTQFQDTLSQLLQGTGAPTDARGGTNPAQIGLGVRLAGITTNFGQGATQVTGRSTDLMISGDGFFVVDSDGEQMFTRAGSLNFDAQGRLVTAEGAFLQGWNAARGVIDTNVPLGTIQLPVGTQMNPQPTRQVGVTGNLPSDTTSTTPISTTIHAFDAAGNARDVSAAFTRSSAAGVSPTVWQGTLSSAGATTAVTLEFDANGALVSTTPAPATIGGVEVDFSGVTGYAGTSTFEASSQDGYAVGTLKTFTLGPDGILTGVFSNGQKQALGQVALGTFANPAGLEKAGGSLYRTTANSGAAQVGVAGDGGRGTLAGGTLEMSNVDLAQEFTNLIIAQRGFQANSRVITSSDELLQDLVNLKR